MPRRAFRNDPADNYGGPGSDTRDQDAQVNGATEKQIAFILRLLDEKDLSSSPKVEAASNEEYASAIEVIKATIPSITKKQASEWIESLLKFPNLASKSGPTEQLELPSVPDGRYALRMLGDDLNPIHFFTLKTGKDGGRWAGFRFLDRHVSDDRFAVKGETKKDIMERISSDPQAAAKLYGHETNHCGICGKELTQESSRQAGIGPVCAQKSGW